jgi:hypothetical protein
VSRLPSNLPTVATEIVSSALRRIRFRGCHPYHRFHRMNGHLRLPAVLTHCFCVSLSGCPLSLDVAARYVTFMYPLGKKSDTKVMGAPLRKGRVNSAYGSDNHACFFLGLFVSVT